MTIDQAPARRVPTVMHVRCPDRLPEELYRLVLEQLAELSPVVQALPPTAALAELKGALRYHGVGADVDRLGQMLRVRTLTRCGADLRIGIGPTISVAATASAQVPEPGGVLVVAPDRAAEWLAGLPVEALHGVGPRQAGVLHHYGIHTAGLLAAVPAQTVQRLLGGRAGRLARDRARGADPRPVVPRSLPASVSVSCSFARHALDGPDVRSALLRLVVQLGRTLRRRRQSPQALTLTLSFAGTGRWSKTHRLPEPSAHEDDLRAAAYRLMDAAGLQRGRLTALSLRAEELCNAGTVARQITLDHAREARLVAEAAVDRVRDKFGAGVIGPAAYRAAS